jgi:hypothetical protein
MSRDHAGFPFETQPGQVYACACRKTEKVVITNADCIVCRTLGLNNHVFIPHIIDDELFILRRTFLYEAAATEEGRV